MAESIAENDSSDAKESSPAKLGSSSSRSARPLKTPLTRKGMTPQRFIDAINAVGTISTETLDAMEKAIEEGCGKVTAHGG